jgi:acetyl esterase/lipase
MITKADKDVVLHSVKTDKMARPYAGDHDLKHPLISPLYADLHGLPPLLIQVGTDEILLDDSTRLVEKARTAGVDVTLEVWDDMDHVFQAQAIILPEARRAIAGIGEFMQKATGGQ